MTTYSASLSENWAETNPFTITANCPEDLSVKVFEAPKRGKTVLILGAIHGNETVGPEAIHQLMDRLNNQDIIQEEGRIVCIPVCNPEAYKQKIRQIHENLNRVIDEDAINVLAEFYEKKLAAFIMEMIKQSDLLLDIHSTLREALPFTVTAASDVETMAMADAVGCSKNIIDIDDPKRPDYTTVRYAAKHGIPAVLLESGQHDDPLALQAATQAIMNVLGFQGIVKYEPQRINAEPSENLKITETFFNDEVAEYCNTECPFHGQTYNKGDHIARLNDGRIIVAPLDGTAVLFPNKGIAENQKAGAEQFYLSVPLSSYEPGIRLSLYDINI